MALTFIAVSSATALTGSVVVANPAGLVAGNLLLAIAGDAEGGQSVTVPTGFVPFVSYNDPGSGCIPATQGPRITAGWKIATASDVVAGSFTFVSAGFRASAALLSFSGHDPTNPINSSAFVQDNSITAPSVTTTKNDCLIVRAKTAGSNCFGTRTPGCAGTAPGGHTLRAELCTNSEMGVYTKDTLVAAGLQPTAILPVGGAYATPYHLGLTVAIAPSPQGGGGRQGGRQPGKPAPPKPQPPAPPKKEQAPQRIGSIFLRDFWEEIRR